MKTLGFSAVSISVGQAIDKALHEICEAFVVSAQIFLAVKFSRKLHSKMNVADKLSVCFLCWFCLSLPTFRLDPHPGLACRLGRRLTRVHALHEQIDNCPKKEHKKIPPNSKTGLESVC
ncbi:hypothetical protein [Neglectibacter caecimuris]|uniref:hypothetical protein n=1 Tax=Neglectibacter caecimuris TaxID=3093658 RepID=UPI002AC96395|nr:hypothetical protein [Neglectibacter sp. M00184]